MTGDPQHVARVLVSIIQGANDTATELYIARQAGTVPYTVVEPRLAVYWQAMERVLGLSAGTFTQIDRAILDAWFG